MELNSGDGNRFFCLSCYKSFSSKKGLQIHVKKIHEVVPGSPKVVKKMACLEAGCEFRCSRLSDFRHHLSECHGHSFAEMVQQFDTMDHFILWLANFEKQNDVEFFRSTLNTNRSSKVVYFKCNRSGFYRESKKTAQRRTKEQGSCKIEGYCTAYIKTKEDFGSGIVTMSMCNTHYGHDLQLKHLRLPKADKILIEEKLNKGLDMEDVILEVKKTTPKTAERTNLIKHKDVYNISNKLRMKPGERYKSSIPLVNIDSLSEQPKFPNNVTTWTINPVTVSDKPSHTTTNEDNSLNLLNQLNDLRSIATNNLQEVVRDLQSITDFDTIRDIISHARDFKCFVKARLQYISNPLTIIEDSTCVANGGEICLPIADELSSMSGTAQHNSPTAITRVPVDEANQQLMSVAQGSLIISDGPQECSVASKQQPPHTCLVEQHDAVGLLEREDRAMECEIPLPDGCYAVAGNSIILATLDDDSHDLHAAGLADEAMHSSMATFQAVRGSKDVLHNENSSVGEPFLVTHDNDIDLHCSDMQPSYLLSESSRSRMHTADSYSVADDDHALQELGQDAMQVEDSYLVAGNDDVLSQVLNPTYASFSKDGKTCFIRVGKPTDNAPIQLVIP